jgi:2-polyprenyl-3-methyl-5-hydroxy-6-metoxy-1,4-benzoquinol methylase
MQLKRLLAALYDAVEGTGRPLGWKQRLTSAWRPLYAPFTELLRWIPSGASMLDIGCGSGAFLFLANQIRHAAPCHGIDINRTAIDLAKAANPTADIDFQVALEPDPAVLAAVSVVTLIDVLHHVPNVSKPHLLALVLASMPAGGRIIIKDLDERPAWRALANRITDYLSTRSKVAYISRADIEELLGDSGFQIVASQELHKHVWSHYLVVADKVVG